MNMKVDSFMKKWGEFFGECTLKERNLPWADLGGRPFS
jgi:hypothetical protein